MVVDCHAHYVHPELVASVQAGDFAPHLRWQEGRFIFPTEQSRPFFHGMTDLEDRLRHMDTIGIDCQILSTWVDVFGYGLPASVAGAYHRAVNQGLARAVKGYPDRFRFVASVPLPNGEMAADVLREAVQDLGAVGAMIGTNVLGRNLDDGDLAPFWQEAARLGVPVVLHPVNVAAAQRLQSYYLENLLGNPFDSTIAAASLIFGGILDRHPELNVLLLHGGGYFPFAVGRLDHGFDVRPEPKTASRPPSQYLSRFHYDVVVYDPELLRMVKERVGEDRMVLGTDYPFDMEPKNAVALTQSGLKAEARWALEIVPGRLFRIRGSQ